MFLGRSPAISSQCGGWEGILEDVAEVKGPWWQGALEGLAHLGSFHACAYPQETLNALSQNNLLLNSVGWMMMMIMMMNKLLN